MYIDMWIIDTFYVILFVAGLIFCFKMISRGAKKWDSNSHKPLLFYYIFCMIFIVADRYIEGQQEEIPFTIVFGIVVPLVYSLIRLVYLYNRKRF